MNDMVCTCSDYGDYNCAVHGPHPEVKHKIAKLEAKVKDLQKKMQIVLDAMPSALR
jgi:hypothetical protein